MGTPITDVGSSNSKIEKDIFSQKTHTTIILII